MPTFTGENQGHNLKVGVVVSRFNHEISQSLLNSCLERLIKLHVKSENIDVVWVPGAFEIPFMAKKLAVSKNYHSLITLGSVIRGETLHFDFVAGECSRGIAQVSLETGVPVVFGVLTTENEEQAWARSGFNGSENKGVEFAECAIEMATILTKIH